MRKDIRLKLESKSTDELESLLERCNQNIKKWGKRWKEPVEWIEEILLKKAKR